MLNFKEVDKGILWFHCKLTKQKHKIRCNNIKEIWLRSIDNLENKRFHINWIQKSYDLSKANIIFRGTNWKGRINFVIHFFKSLITFNFDQIKDLLIFRI